MPNTNNIFEQRGELVNALPYSDAGWRLRHKMNDCGRTDIWTGNTSYCWQHACPRCRGAYGKRQGKKARVRFAGANRDELSFMTILFGVAGSTAAVPHAWKTGVRDLRNRVTAARKSSRRWGAVNLMGWFEADPFAADDVPILGSRMQDYLGSVGHVMQWPGGVSWIVHLHAIVRHPKIDWQEIRDTMSIQWHHPHSVDVTPFNQERFNRQSVDQSITNISSYSHKFHAGREIYSEEGGSAIIHHPVGWLSELGLSLFEYNSGMRSWNCSIGSSNKTMPPRTSDILGITKH